MVRAIRNPWNQEIADNVPVCGEETVDFAIQELRRGAGAMATWGGERLGKIFSATGAKIREQSESLAALISLEQGKPLNEARQEVDAAAHLLTSIGKDSYRLGRQFLPLPMEVRVGDRFGFTRRRSLGISGIIAPNTFPLLIPTMMVAPALAAGNAVVLKPASQTPFTALRLVRYLLEAGLPPEAIACLTGPGEQTGQAICRHPEIDQVCCYGGMETIRSIRASLGLVPLMFHHGGMGVCVVAADADLDWAVRQIVSQRFENAGQTATTAGLIFVDDRVQSDFIERLVTAVGKLNFGDPKAPGTQIGPLTETSRAVRAARIVGDSVATGARLALGSGINQGNLISPVVMVDVDPTNQSLFPVRQSREWLSPIIGVSTISGDLGQIGVWLDPRTQIVVSLFTRDLDLATVIASQLPVYNVHVNGVPTWRDGLIFSSQSGRRLGRRKSEQRVNDLTCHQDVVFHATP